MLAPRRMSNTIVKVVVNYVKLHDMTCVPSTHDPLSKHTFPLAKMGKSAEDEVVTLTLPHAVLVNSLDLNIEFVRPSL